MGIIEIITENDLLAELAAEYEAEKILPCEVTKYSVAEALNISLSDAQNLLNRELHARRLVARIVVLGGRRTNAYQKAK